MRLAVVVILAVAMAGCGAAVTPADDPPKQATVDSTIDVTISPDSTMEIR